MVASLRTTVSVIGPSIGTQNSIDEPGRATSPVLRGAPVAPGPVTVALPVNWSVKGMPVICHLAESHASNSPERGPPNLLKVSDDAGDVGASRQAAATSSATASNPSSLFIGPPRA